MERDMPTDIPADQADIDNADIEEVESKIVKAMHEHWRLYLGEGAGLLILGLIAVAVPPLTTSLSEGEPSAPRNVLSAIVPPVPA